MASPKMYILVSQIARLRISGIKDNIIAQTLNLRSQVVYRITKTQYYKEVEEALLHGHLSAMDAKLAKKRDVMEGIMEQATPQAVMTIVEVARQRRDLRSALAAAKDILRMDPNRTFAVDGDSRIRSSNSPGLPASLFESIAKDADGVSVAVGTKLDELKRGSAKQDA